MLEKESNYIVTLMSVDSSAETINLVIGRYDIIRLFVITVVSCDQMDEANLQT